MTAQNPLAYLNNEPLKYPTTLRADRDPTTQDLQSWGTKWSNSADSGLFLSKGAGIWVEIS